MKCDFCSSHFEIPVKGSGGKNRLFCFNCLPDGLERYERSRLRDRLYSSRMRTHKESIGCKKCGYNTYGGALEWHHPNDDKIGNVSDRVKRSWKDYLSEVEKCVLLCSCCHKEEHAGINKICP